MRRNRRKRVNASVLSPFLVGIIVLGVSVMLFYWCLESKCDQLQEELRKHSQHYETLENERLREEARWNSNKMRENIEKAMTQHGLDMKYADSSQIVHMDDQGTPLPGQIAVARFRKEQRLTAERLAQKRQP